MVSLADAADFAGAALRVGESCVRLGLAVAFAAALAALRRAAAARAPAALALAARSAFPACLRSRLAA